MRHALSHLSDGALLQRLTILVADDRATAAELLAHLAEVDARQLYRSAAHPSMHAYCVDELHMSEDEACRRIRAARAGRDFPEILRALADGRLHLTAVVLLAPHLTPENAPGLLEAAAHKSRAEVRLLLAGRFPQADLPTHVEPLAGPPPALALPDPQGPAPTGAPAPGMEAASALARMDGPVIPGRVMPLAPRRFGLQVTIGQETHDKLRYAQSLLGYALPAGDMATLLDRALDALVHDLERRKFAPGARTRRGGRRRSGTRYVPAAVRCAVWERDEGRCTFVSEGGRRCSARANLEFDHVEPFARGGEATVAGIRLRCRAHNQYDAEQVYGAGFMAARRQEARQRASARRAADAGQKNSPRSLTPHTVEHDSNRPADQRPTDSPTGWNCGNSSSTITVVSGLGDDVTGAVGIDEKDAVECLRALGIPAEAARRAVANCGARPGVSLEERVREALSYHARVRYPNARRTPLPGSA